MLSLLHEMVVPPYIEKSNQDCRMPGVVEVDSAGLKRVQDLYDRGLFLQAWQAAQEMGDPRSWSGVAALILAGRLAGQLGGGTVSAWLLRRAWLQDRAHGEACYYRAHRMLARGGPYAALRWMLARGEPAAPSGDDIRSAWWALLGQVQGALRDFEAAHQALGRALEIAPQSAWVHVCRAQVLEAEDRYDDALQAAQHALELSPWYRPAVQQLAHLLTIRDRNDEALALLSEGSSRLESQSVTAQLLVQQTELHLYKEAAQTADRVELLAPLAEKLHKQWLAAQRSEIAYKLGDYDAAAKYARLAKTPYYTAIAERLEDQRRRQAKAVTLPVGFVRQHHFTCAPATLAAISQYWNLPAEHLQVAEAICYDGTSAYGERTWAVENGWLAREFTVQEEAARRLIDAGIPFTLATVEPHNAHLQAVVGYDGRRGTLVFRDPFLPQLREPLADKLMARYRAFGPRGMALVPLAEAARLEAIPLPDTAAWDRLHALDGALLAHRRADAQREADALAREFPDHFLALEARHRLAIYDRNPPEQLAVVEALLARFPDEPTLQLERLALWRDHAHREERLAVYKEQCAKSDVHPVFWMQYADELRIDSRRHDDVIWMLKRAIRRWPTEPRGYYLLAGIYWDRRQFDEALALYRIAMCQNDKDEQMARAYFQASRWFRKTEEALDLLRARFQRFGHKSSLPGRTLFHALNMLERSDEARAVLEESLRLRPDDGEQLLFAADAYLGFGAGYFPRARELLSAAETRSPRGWRLRTSARLASLEGDKAQALALWRQVLAIEPLAMDAHTLVARLLAETDSPQAALDYVAAAAEQFPHYVPLQELRVEWLRDRPEVPWEPVIRRVMELHPENAWLRRELSYHLLLEGRLEEAWQECEIAGRLEPHNVSYPLLRANLLRREGKFEQAKESLREVLRISIDDDYAIGMLLSLCHTPAERRQELEFVREQLVQQVIFGDGLLAYRAHAAQTLPAEELLTSLREGLAARPDLWHAWSAVAQQLLSMNRLDEAWQVIQEATSRFPLLPRLWLHRAEVCRAREMPEQEGEALRTACDLNPDWSEANRALCEYHERRGDTTEALALLRRTVARAPLDAANHLHLAELLWRLGRRDEALHSLEETLKLEPGLQRGWDLLVRWCGEHQMPQRARQAVRQLTQSRPGEARTWLILARTLDQPKELDEQLAAIDRALALNPKLVDAYELRAIALAQAGRWDEAHAACTPAVWKDGVPTELQACAAWIEAVRGRRPEAIARMWRVVESDPEFYGGWMRLAEWCRDANDLDGLLAAAENLVRISPHDEAALSCLAEAHALKGDRISAKAVYSRACELHPHLEYAGNALFDLQLEDNQLEAAEETLQRLARHVNSPFVLARMVQLHARQGQKEQALKALTRVCTLPCQSDWPVAAAVDAVMQADWNREALPVLESVLSAPDVHPEVGTKWMQVAAALGRSAARERLAEHRPKGELGRRAVRALAAHVSAHYGLQEFAQFVWEHGEWLRSDTLVWGTTGYCLMDDPRAAARWMHDWRSRADAQPWMLVNLAVALRHVGRARDAVEVSRRALENPDGDLGSLMVHRAWLAVEAAADGDAEELARRLAELDPQQLDEYYRPLYTLANAVHAASGGAASAARRQLGQIALGKLDVVMRRVYRRCVLAVGRHGGWTGRLWSWWRWLLSI